MMHLGGKISALVRSASARAATPQQNLAATLARSSVCWSRSFRPSLGRNVVNSAKFWCSTDSSTNLSNGATALVRSPSTSPQSSIHEGCPSCDNLSSVSSGSLRVGFVSGMDVDSGDNISIRAAQKAGVAGFPSCVGSTARLLLHPHLMMPVEPARQFESGRYWNRT